MNTDLRRRRQPRRFDPPPHLVGWRRTRARVLPWVVFLLLLAAFTAGMVWLAFRVGGT